MTASDRSWRFDVWPMLVQAMLVCYDTLSCSSTLTFAKLKHEFSASFLKEDFLISQIVHQKDCFP